MSARARLRRSAAVAFVAAVTAGSALALTACDPETQTGAPAKPSATASKSGSPAASASASASASTAPSATASTAAPSSAAPATSAPAMPSATPTKAALNGTAGNGLTISNGTRYVVMNGTVVDFGTVVRDLAWSPDGKHAAFVDGEGNLEMSAPDGSNRVMVAKAPSGVTWSHPTWQVNGAGENGYIKARNNLLFTADDHGTLTLLSAPAQAGGVPAVLSLNPYFDDENTKPLPQTGNLWPNVGGHAGTAVYANQADGQVYIRDDYLRQQGGAVTKGSQPALGPDEQDVVFVRSVGGHDHIFESSLREQKKVERDLTPDAATDYTEPAVSKDGKTVAFRGQDGVYTVPLAGGKIVKVSDTAGLPAYR
ncbi:hypothetical protein AB0K51_26875 [Kitasatospora sp. NPDC049285]|uniref:TolB family protein n=1 Tax=Kitasatospora sp. NPDC049285 TaxID=3157096 RepID=UPI0034242221